MVTRKQTEVEAAADKFLMVYENEVGIKRAIGQIVQKGRQVWVFFAGWDAPDESTFPNRIVLEGNLQRVADNFFRIDGKILREAESGPDDFESLQAARWDSLKTQKKVGGFAAALDAVKVA